MLACGGAGGGSDETGSTSATTQTSSGSTSTPTTTTPTTTTTSSESTSTPTSEVTSETVTSETATSETATSGSGTTDTPPACGTAGWLSYNADWRRSGGTDGCVPGALQLLWRYDPKRDDMIPTKSVYHAIAEADAMYVLWSAPNGPYVGTTAMDRVDTAGARVWTWDSGTDSNLGNWPSLMLDLVVLNDDGLYLLDPITGAKVTSTGVDYWGQTTTDGQRILAVNTSHVDGPPVLVGGFGVDVAQQWAQLQYGMCRIDASDSTGGLALDGGTLFYAPRYSVGASVMLPFASGVYAFDPAVGTMKWTQPTMPAGQISAGDGRVYLAEDPSTLTARSQVDGAVVWTVAVAGLGAQAPVLAAGAVIVGSQAGVEAFDPATGAPLWTAPVMGAAVFLPTISFSGGCDTGTQQSGSFGGVPTANLAAALGSNTLIAAGYDGLHVLDLTSGAELWTGVIEGSVGSVRDPVVVGDRVYVVDGAGVIALQATP